MPNDGGKINRQTFGWWAAKVIFPDGEQLDIIATLTAQPDIHRRGLERTYITATVECWEVDESGNPIDNGQHEAAKAAAAKKANDAVHIQDEAKKEGAKRPSGMVEWPRA